MLSSSIPNPIPPFGSDVTLTCAVELSQAVDVPVTVNTVLTTDEGFTRTSTAQQVMGSSTNYASEFTISPFRRSDSGLYICTATVSLPSNTYISNSSTATHSLRVTTGEIKYFEICTYMYLYTVWRVIFVGTNFRGKSEKALKINFCGFKFRDSNQYRDMALHKCNR